MLLTLAATAWSGWGMADSPPAPGRLVSVGDYRLHLDCSGDRDPTVVLDAGLGGTSIEWLYVKPQLAGHVRTCAFDRAGYGWSDGGPLPRTSKQIAFETRELLRNAGLEGPFFLVGHSFGGFNARVFAGYYPEEIAGLVLVDAAHEDQFERSKEYSGLSNAPVGGNFLLTSLPTVPEELPADVRELVLSLVASYKTMRTMRGELAAFRVSARQARRSPWPSAALVAVISRGRQVWPDDVNGNASERIWRELQADLGSRGKNTRHVSADRSGHYVHLEQPEIVVREVLALIRQYRHGHSQ